jgi:hypothetical protein
LEGGDQSAHVLAGILVDARRAGSKGVNAEDTPGPSRTFNRANQGRALVRAPEVYGAVDELHVVHASLSNMISLDPLGYAGLPLKCRVYDGRWTHLVAEPLGSAGDRSEQIEDQKRFSGARRAKDCNKTLFRNQPPHAPADRRSAGHLLL